MEVATNEFEDLVAEVAGHLNAQHARLVRLTAHAERDGSWFGVGFLSITHWLTIRAGIAPGRARQIVTIARRIDDFPTLMAAFERGELSVDQVHEVAAKAPAWADRQVTEFALVATVRQLRRMIRDELFHAGHIDVSWADALAEIARRSLAGVASDRRERFRTNMHIHTDTGAAQLGNGVAVPPAIRDYLVCDGEIRPGVGATTSRSA